MFKTLILLSFIFQGLMANGVKDKLFYGKKIISKKSVSLDTVLKNYQKYENKNIVMKAKVKKVCAKKGRWMTLQGSSKTFRVKFYDYGFFVPMSLVGQQVLVEGQMKRKTISIEDTKHYLEDAGASKEKISSVVKPSFEYRIVAKGVKPLAKTH